MIPTSALMAVALLTAAPAAVPVTSPIAQAQAAEVPSAPRQTVRAVAARIRELYFDPAAGELIARGLESSAEAGTFDALTDGRELAAALTARLRPADGHFRVVFASVPAGTAVEAPRDRDESDLAALGHYGFRRVEILPGNVGYIMLRQFSGIDFADPSDPARQAADAALDFVAGADAVIFDLRGNGGGEPSMVGYLVSAFVPAGAQIYSMFHTRTATESERPLVTRSAPRLDVPLYVLIDGRSGSAAEAFPYTLQAAGRATVVGETSVGAANPGELVPAGDGFSVFVSDGTPRNPITGGNWEGTGVKPDVATASEAALNRAHALALERIVAADADRIDAVWTLETLGSPVEPGDLSAYVGAYGRMTVAAADGRLAVGRERGASTVLLPLGGDRFAVEGDPLTRYSFSRDAGGTVTGFEAATLGGPTMRARRSR